MKRPVLLLLALLLVSAILFLNLSSPNFNSRIETSHIASLEKFQEKLFLTLKFNKNRKADYYQYLLEKRLAELKYAVTAPDQLDSVEETASRYTTYLGNLNNFIIQNRMSDHKQELLNTYAEHSSLIEGLQKNYQFGSGWWLAVQHDINTLKLFSDQIKTL